MRDFKVEMTSLSHTLYFSAYYTPTSDKCKNTLAQDSLLSEHNIISPQTDKNPRINDNQTHVSKSEKQPFWPIDHLHLLHKVKSRSRKPPTSMLCLFDYSLTYAASQQEKVKDKTTHFLLYIFIFLFRVGHIAAVITCTFLRARLLCWEYFFSTVGVLDVKWRDRKPLPMLICRMSLCLINYFSIRY